MLSWHPPSAAAAVGAAVVAAAAAVGAAVVAAGSVAPTCPSGLSAA